MSEPTINVTEDKIIISWTEASSGLKPATVILSRDFQKAVFFVSDSMKKRTTKIETNGFTSTITNIDSLGNTKENCGECLVYLEVSVFHAGNTTKLTAKSQGFIHNVIFTFVSSDKVRVNTQVNSGSVYEIFVDSLVA